MLTNKQAENSGQVNLVTIFFGKVL
ncbi:MAG: hypothetical protein ACJAU1_001697 [Psychromonas sp.]